MPPSHYRRESLTAGIVAYGVWGLFPLYWPLLLPATPLEILAHRVLWSFVLVGIVLLVLRQGWGWLRRLARRDTWPRLLGAGVLIGVNWLTYIWAVNNRFVVEASLGYFINPLVNVALGMILFGERLGRGARIGGLLALVGVAVIAWGSWQTLWISLWLAFSFGFYGTMKKSARLGALEGLLVESAVLLPVCLAYLIGLQVAGTAQFGTSPGATVMLIGAGLVTAFPLWLFAVAAPGLPFGVLGILQYIAPTIQFLLGITVFGQRVSPSYWAGLILVWVGSAVYLTWTLRGGCPQTQESAAEEAVAAG